MSNKSAKIIIEDKEYNFPIKKSSIGPNGIDISTLYHKTGFFAYDNGFMSTASCKSSITFIDGEKGILRYRGYDIYDLAEKGDFLEVSHLLLNKNLPNKNQYKIFKEKISHHSIVNEQIKNIFGAFRHSAHPMAIILSVVGSLSAFYHESIDMNSEEGRELAVIKMIAKIPTICAMTYKYSVAQAFIYPNDELSFAENFLYMMFSRPNKKYKVNKVLADTLEKIFILHADHEQNASTATVRTSGSCGSNPFACVSAGIASLWGTAHGGANEAVINMLKSIGDISNIPEFIKRAKDKNDPFRLMGFGHRVYKNYDPRASVLRKSCKQVLAETGNIKNPLLKIAIELERIALDDEYFIERKLYPNIDFYSGIIYEAMNIPSQMFTAIFSLARTAGWCAQWYEMWQDPDLKITRPRQLYIGDKLKSIQ